MSNAIIALILTIYQTTTRTSHGLSDTGHVITETTQTEQAIKTLRIDLHE